MSKVDTTNVPLSGDTAHRLADLVGVERDLRWTAHACAVLIELAQRAREKVEPMILEALHDAALIRYGRCFKTGLRNAFRIPNGWTDDLPEPLRQAHDDAINLRDMHIAHSVNDWETNVPCAQIARVKEYGAATVRAVHVSHERVVMLSISDLRTLEQLATTLADRAAKVGEKVQAQLLKEIRGMSPRELERRAPHFPRAGSRKVGAGRRRR